MRGEDRVSGALFSYVDVEARIPAKHPLRAMRRVTDAALAELDRTFSAQYEGSRHPSIPPERLLRAALLQLLYSIRSERQLVERLEFDLLLRWFVGLSIDEKAFDASSFSKKRDRFVHPRGRARVSVFAPRPAGGEEAFERGPFFGRRNAVEGLGVDEELPFQGRLGRAASAGAQRRSRLPQDEAVERDARFDNGQGRAPLPQRRGTGEPSWLSWPRLDGEPQRARGGGRGDLGDGTAEREAAARLSERLPKGATLGADKGYDAEAFVEGLRSARSRRTSQSTGR